jgi:hypothetical protein
MHRKVHAIISRALTEGRVRQIDWYSESTPPLDPQEVAREIARKGLKDACMGRAFMENEDAVDLTRRALALGVPIDDALDGELSPLALAAKCRVVEVANYLLDRGARATSQALIWACASHGFTLATHESPLELVERLLKAGADVGEGGSPYVGGDKLTPLYYAVDQLGTGNVPLARLLLDYGAPIDVGNVDASAAGLIGGQTPLYKACQYGEVAMTRLLLARGAGWDKKAYSDPKSAKWATPLLAVRLGMASPAQDQINALFDDFLAHYWALRVALRLFGRRENHASGPQRVVLGDAYLPTKIGAFVVGDGILVKKKK